MPSEVDRYPVPVLGGDPAAFKDYLRGLERQIRELQAARPLGNTTLSNGTLRVVDDAGNVLVELGKVAESPDLYGLRIRNADGNALLLSTGLGLHAPRLVAWTRPVHTPQIITSGSYQPSHQALFREVLTPVHAVTVGVSTAPGTTGQLYLTSNDGSVTDSPVLTFSGPGNYEINWQHGSDVGSGRHIIQMMARRSAGAGNVEIYEPYGVGSAPPDVSPLDTWTAV